MAIICDPNVSKIEEGLDLEDVREAVQDPNRYQFKNPTGSVTFIGVTEDEKKPKVVTVVLKRESDGRDWVTLEAHKATEEEEQVRKEQIGRPQL